MVINDKHRFVFVHVPKAAGTSISAVLSALPGNNAALIHRTTKHETLPQFFGRTVETAALLHYTVFGFVRNPWSRMVSLYRYLVEARPRPEIDGVKSFDGFLRRAEAREPWIAGLHSLRPQVDFFEAPAATCYIGHFEHLQDDFAAIGRRLGFNDRLPRVNASSSSRGDYRTEYSTALAEIVGGLFADDVERFGYEFDRPEPHARSTNLEALFASASPSASR